MDDWDQPLNVAWFTGSREFLDFTAKLQKWKADGLIDNPQVNPFPHSSTRHTAELLGYNDAMDMHLNGNISYVLDTLKKLNGPRGWVLYNVLLARRGMKREEDK